MIKTTLRPGETYEADVLLNELVLVEGAGNVELICTIEIADLKSKPQKVRANLSLTFTGRMSPQHLQDVLKKLSDDLESTSPEVRYRAARSLGAIRSDEALGLLRRALVDSQEAVQMAAVSSLSYFQTPAADELMREATESKNELVRIRAQSILAGPGRPKKD
jgi:HEAT repeat protein